MSAATTTDVSDASVVGVKVPALLKAVVSYGAAALLAAVLTMICLGTTTFSLSTSKDFIIIPAVTVPAAGLTGLLTVLLLAATVWAGRLSWTRRLPGTWLHAPGRGGFCPGLPHLGRGRARLHRYPPGHPTGRRPVPVGPPHLRVLGRECWRALGNHQYRH